MKDEELEETLKAARAPKGTRLRWVLAALAAGIAAFGVAEWLRRSRRRKAGPDRSRP